MISDGSFKEFECALSDDKHFIYEPIELPCGDCACKSCILNEDEFICKSCDELIQHENVYEKVSKSVQNSFKRCIDCVYKIIEQQSVKSLDRIKDFIDNKNKRIYSQVEFIKEEIDIHIESIKVKLDKFGEKFKTELEDIKKTCKNFENEPKLKYKTKNFEENVEKLINDIKNQNELCDKKLNDYQKNLQEMNKFISKLPETKIVFKPSENFTLNKNSIGIIEQKVLKSQKFEIEEDKLIDQFCRASDKGLLRSVRFLYQNCDSKDILDSFGGNKKWSPLMYAANNGHYGVVGYLCAIGANIDLKDDSKKSNAIILAAKNGHESVVDLLMDHNVDITWFSSNGYSPLIGAAKNGHFKIVEMLLNYSNKIKNQRTNDGYSALHKASQNGHLKIVELLIKHGANVNAIAKDGFSPLLRAVYSGHRSIVELLLKNKAEVNVIAKNGKNPLFYAKKNIRPDIEKVLIKYGAK